MPHERKYAKGTEAALLALCGGTCYWPECGEPVVRFVEGDPVNNLQIAHIRALKPNGPRYTPETDDQVNDFANLILLCHAHHVIVDRRRANDFSVKMLEQWKREREAGGQGALSGLRGVTEDRLQQWIADAVESRDRQVEDALSKISRS